MARRRQQEEDDVSLFPFLSILACIIGVLTLLISTLALAQMDNEVVASLEQLEKAEREVAALQEEIDRLKKQIDQEALKRASEMDERQRELLAAQKRLEELQKRIEELRKQGAQPQKVVEIKVPKVDPASHEQAIKQMQQELKGVREKLAQLEKELKDRKRPPDEPEVTVIPGGSGLQFEPVFVECAAGSVVIHMGDKPERVPLAALETSEAFTKVLNFVAASPRRTLVFLIRDNGLGSYYKARDLADWAKVRNGKLPVLGKGRLDLSYFSKKQGGG